MSLYRTADTVHVKAFKTNSPEHLETLINSWISENTNSQIVDIVYSSHHGTDADVYTALVIHANKIFEEQM